MAGIKGITIEIGAKTSSVDRALKGIQESSRSEEHTSELQSLIDLVCRLLLEKKNSGGSGAVHMFLRWQQRKP